MNRLFCLITGVWMLASCASELGDPIEPVDPEAAAAISPAALPTTVYNLTGRASPAAGATAVNIDTPLTLTFDGPPVLGTGTVQILRQSDDAVVDTIKIGAETDEIGFPGQDRVRRVNVERLLSVSGNTLRIIPHHAYASFA